MTEQAMMMALEDARQYSEKIDTPIYAMSNGHEIEYTRFYGRREVLEELGYWVCSIFENGHRVSA